MTWRAPLYFLLGLFLGGYAAWANAGYALVNPPAGLSFNPNTGYNWKPDVSTPPANGSWSAHGFMRYGGKNIPVPASWGAAANAATFAKNTLRFNPWWFVGTAVMTIAIDAGLEFIDDQWMVEDDTVPMLPSGYYRATYYNGADGGKNCSTFAHQCTAVDILNWFPHYQLVRNNTIVVPDSMTLEKTSGGGARVRYRFYTSNGTASAQFNDIYVSGSTCPAGYEPAEGGMCAPANPYRPATEADWDFPVGPLTDTQLDEISRISPDGIPVTTPQLEPVVEPLGNPYTDPVTGEQWRDMIRITPDPTPSSPLRVRLDPYREPMTTPDPTPENPNPVPEPDPTRPNETLPEMWPLFCDWAGPVCELIDWLREPFVEPEPVEVPALELDEPSFGSVGLPSTAGCPAPRVVSLGVGTFQLSYDPFCQLADMIRPLVLVTSYLFAAFILLGVRRG